VAKNTATELHYKHLINAAEEQVREAKMERCDEKTTIGALQEAISVLDRELQDFKSGPQRTPSCGHDDKIAGLMSQVDDLTQKYEQVCNRATTINERHKTGDLVCDNRTVRYGAYADWYSEQRGIRLPILHHDDVE
jgi:hypothetical protein